MKTFKGKAIYNPSGKAGEYSYWGCNLVVGCSNGCQYCYCKKGILKGAMGMDKPQLKKCFPDENEAFEIFKKEVRQNKESLQEYGLFFSFTTDPLLKEFENLHWSAIMFCNENKIPVKVLTKLAGWVEDLIYWLNNSNSDNADLEWRKIIAFGFTLTGHNELEPNASSNTERIEAMKQLHEAGFKTFASIEPIIDFESSAGMILQSYMFCDLYKIGLESGKKYDKDELYNFVDFTNKILWSKSNSKIYWKDSITKIIGIQKSLNCVDRDYNLFKCKV